MNNWKETTLGGICDFANGKGLKNSFYTDEGVYSVWGANGRIARTNELLKNEPVVVIGRVGAYCGSVHLVNEPSWVTDNAIIATAKPENDLRFIYYLLKRLDLRRTAIGSAQPLMTQGGLKVVRVKIPTPIQEQKAIAHILGSLDDKIELNRRMNETLEMMAKAIFKSWFIDFDPVKAKAEGRDLKLPKEIADLFPDSFEESELGPIPKGWKVDTVSNIININPPTKLAKNTVAKYVDMKALPTEGFSISGYIEKEYKGGSKFCKNDVLLARITPCLENGKTSLAYFLDDDEVGFGSTEFIVMRHKNAITPEYVYCLARDEKFRKHCISSMVGSSGRQRVQNACFDHYYLAVPSNDKLLKSFKDQTDSLFNQIIINAKASMTLASLRDTLLPKLLSGELRVPDAEKMTEGVE